MAMKTYVLGCSVFVAAIAAVACGSPHRSEAFTGSKPKLDTAEKRHGEMVFAQNCNQCHPLGEGGLGPALNDKPAPAGAIALVIRIGPGDMPAFDESELSDDDVDAVTQYVVALRQSGSDVVSEDVEN
jgi:mono/diheme cytochrome c family protein